MTRPLQRFAAVGVVVTAVDLAVLAALRLLVGLPVAVADALSIAVAAVLSWSLHRGVTPRDDPLAGWLREPGKFLRVTLLAGALDVAVTSAWAPVFGSSHLRGLLAAKVLALAAAAAVRATGYRSAVLPGLRSEQARRIERGPAPGELRLTVVVPAYGEEDRIASTVARLREALASVGPLEVVVVDDGSTDATAQAARDAGADQVISFATNRGKGAAVRAGMLASRGRTVAFTDADLAYAPEQIARLLAEVEAGWDMVVGSRRHVETRTLVRARRLRELSGRLFNLLTLAVLLGQYRDTQCGLKAFRSDVARLLGARARIDGFAFDVELFHLAERYRLSLLEVPVELTNTTTSTVRVGVDALRMVRDLLRVRRLAAAGVYEPGAEDARLLAR